MHFLFFIFVFLLCFSNSTFSQNPNELSASKTIEIRVVDGDTTFYSKMNDLYISANPTPSVFKSARDERKYWSLVRNVKTVYPYAKLAKSMLDSMNQQFLILKTDYERQLFAKKLEKELEKKVTPILLKLTYQQGDILIKLIDRETGQSSYQLVKELRGSFRAAFYQTIARLFTHNLKDKYDKEGDDKTLEMIIQGIEAGYY